MKAGHYLWDGERVNHFVNVHLHCIVSNLKKISKMSMLPSPEKISAEAHLHQHPGTPEKW